MAKIKLGFVGAGSMGQCAHLRNYANLAGCEVVALAETRSELGRQVAAKYHIPHVYQSPEDMFAHEALDGIIAAQPFTHHGTFLPRLLAARIPLFTEKPLAGSVQQGEIILDALAESGTWHMLGYHKRSDPATMYAKTEIDRLKQSGELGAFKYVRLLMPPGDWITGGFSDLITSDEPYPALANDPAPDDMDTQMYQEYITFVNFYIHQVNLLRHLLGCAYTVTYADPSGVLLAVQSEEGVPGLIEMAPFTTSIDWQESAFVAFEHGWVKLELPAPLALNRPGTVTIFRDPANGATPQITTPQLPMVHAMRQQAMNFLAAIRGEMPPLCEAAEALEDLKVARDYLHLLQATKAKSW